jgi:CHRD domain-containing protein
MKRNLLAALFLGAVAAVSLATPSSALGTRTFGVVLNGAAEVPPNGSAGTGNAAVTLDDVTGAVTVTGFYTGLGSNANAAHIHGPAPAGMNAGIILGLTQTGGTTGNFSGSGTLTAGQITSMINGLTYLNVHTNLMANGEIRGQIVASVPAMSKGWIAGLVLSALGIGALVLGRRVAA